MDLVVRRYGTMLDISPDGKSPLPKTVVDLLAPHMTYVYKESVQGANAYDPVTGQRVHVRLTPKQLYCMQQGRLVCGYGYLKRVVHVLAAAGHSVKLLDLTPDSQRPKCYNTYWENVERHISFRAPQQRECLEIVAASEGGIINAPTGFGKTTMLAAMALLYPYANFHVVVAGTTRVETAVRALTKHIPNVGKVGDGTNRLQRVTVFSADSLHLSNGDADFLIGDEVHELMAPTYSRQLGQIYRFSRNFGLSASPYGRFDGADAKLECLFGPEIFRMTYADAVSLGLTTPIRVNWVPVDMDRNPCANKTGVPKKRWGIWRNEVRNERIAEAAREYGPDVQVLILVETVEHAVYLKSVLPEFELCYSEQGMTAMDRDRYIKNELLPTNEPVMTAERRQQMRKAFECAELKKVIATDVWATGVDFEQLAVVIRADARSSAILDVQAPGRASRIYENKSYSEIIDFTDEFDNGFHLKAKKRRENYAAKEWEQNWGKRRIRR